MTEKREIKIGNIFGATGGNYAGNVYDKNGLSPCINTCEGGYRQPIILELVINKQCTKNNDGIYNG